MTKACIPPSGSSGVKADGQAIVSGGPEHGKKMEFTRGKYIYLSP